MRDNGHTFVAETASLLQTVVAENLQQVDEGGDLALEGFYHFIDHSYEVVTVICQPQPQLGWHRCSRVFEAMSSQDKAQLKKQTPNKVKR